MGKQNVRYKMTQCVTSYTFSFHFQNFCYDMFDAIVS